MIRPAVWLLAALLFLPFTAPPLSAQKVGGILKVMQREDPPSLSIHEELLPTSWPMGSVHNNLALFDPLKPIESMETVIPDLAASWSWNADHTALTFKLRGGVRWHDGTAFGAGDVKHTFDVVRGASAQRLRLNPRKGWYTNVREIVASGEREVTFRLNRPQPALLLLLASGLSPVYPAHVPVAKLRTTSMGTGPFKLVEYRPGSALRVQRNPAYFVKGRPYLDGIEFIVIKTKSTRTAALISGQLDLAMPTETEEKTYTTLKAAGADLQFNQAYYTSNVNIILNTRKPPFSDQRLRQAVNLAMDRGAYTRVVQPGYVVGGFLLPRPHGVWGLSSDELVGNVPGYRDPAGEKERARKIMRELGYSETNRLRLKVTTRSTANYQDAAIWALGELKQIYTEPELDVVETGNWFGRMSRREFSFVVNRTGYGGDEPDIVYFENFTCGNQRNYSDYCSPEAEALFVKQSATVDPGERLKIVQQIERKLSDDGARVSLGFGADFNARKSYVKNFVGHSNHYNVNRYQDIWLDK